MEEWRYYLFWNYFIMLELNKIYCGDCLDLMKQIPDKSIDLVLTDPPYWIGIDWQKESIANNPKHSRKWHEFLWRDNDIPSKEYFDEIFRISKNQIIRWWNYFVCYFTEWHKWWLVWDKWQHWLTMSDCELAYSSFNSPTRIYTKNRVEIQTDWALHPTQKPLTLFKRCLENYSEPWMTILDPFLWSWTTAIACKQMNRNFIGIEKEQKYVEIANKRLQYTQTSLF